MRSESRTELQDRLPHALPSLSSLGSLERDGTTSLYRWQSVSRQSRNSGSKLTLGAKQLLCCCCDRGHLKMLETITQALNVPIAPFMEARHAVPFTLYEEDISLSL